MEKVRPGGSRGAVLSSASRAFRIRSDFGFDFSVTGFNTAEPGKGLAVLMPAEREERRAPPRGEICPVEVHGIREQKEA